VIIPDEVADWLEFLFLCQPIRSQIEPQGPYKVWWTNILFIECLSVHMSIYQQGGGFLNSRASSDEKLV